MDKAKPKIPRAVSRYMSEMARKANAVLRGSESARLRSAKGVAARQRKRAERKAVKAGGI